MSIFVRFLVVGMIIIYFFLGIPAEVLVEAHGSFADAHCIECKKEHEHAWVKGTLITNSIS